VVVDEKTRDFFWSGENCGTHGGNFYGEKSGAKW